MTLVVCLTLPPVIVIPMPLITFWKLQNMAALALLSRKMIALTAFEKVQYMISFWLAPRKSSALVAFKKSQYLNWFVPAVLFTIMVFQNWELMGAWNVIRCAAVPTAEIMPLPVSDTPDPIHTTVPGWMVSVSPLTTVQSDAMT